VSTRRLTVEHRLEGAHVVADDRQRLALVPRVHVHLPAAGLGRRHDDVVTEPLQEGGRRLGGLGDHAVDQAGGAQGDAHVWSFRRLRCRVWPIGVDLPGHHAPRLSGVLTQWRGLRWC
jgi:hypothetical protein